MLGSVQAICDVWRPPTSLFFQPRRGSDGSDGWPRGRARVRAGRGATGSHWKRVECPERTLMRWADHRRPSPASTSYPKEFVFLEVPEEATVPGAGGGLSAEELDRLAREVMETVGFDDSRSLAGDSEISASPTQIERPHSLSVDALVPPRQL